MTDNFNRVKCHKCDYEWVTKSQLTLITCPNCGKKTHIIKDGVKE